MAKLKENLLLMGTNIDDRSIVFDFLDEDQELVYEVKWNLQAYDKDKKEWYDSAEQKEKVNKWAKEYFDTDLEGLNNLPEGIRKNVYHSRKYNSLWEGPLSKFPADRIKELLTVEITDVYEDKFGLKVKFEEDGESYASNFGTTKYVKKLDKYFPEAARKQSALERFEETFGIPFEKGEALIGQEMMVEIKQVGENTFADPKSLSKKQKEQVQAKAQEL